MWKTGHSFIKQKIREENALLAGEMSGHLFFGENFYGHDDAVYAGAKLMEIFARQDGPFSAQLADLPEVFSTPEIRHRSTEEHKFVICERLRDERTGQTYDYRRRSGVEHAEMIGWSGTRQELWSAAEAAERGVKVIICGAGMAAHLAGVVASLTELPVVGVPLPLVSYGGTAMLTLMIGMGLVLSVHIHRDVTISRSGVVR